MIELIKPIEVLQAARLFPAASLDKTKPALASLRIEPLSTHRLALAATDGFVLAWTVLERTDMHGLTDPVLVPNEAFKIIRKQAVHKVKPFLSFDPSDKSLRLGSKDGILTVQQTQANYPQWQKVLPGASSELTPLAATGHKLVAGVSWQVADILSDPTDKSYSRSAQAQHLSRQGARVGTSDLLMFYQEGVYVLAQEPRFAKDASMANIDGLRDGLALIRPNTVKVGV